MLWMFFFHWVARNSDVENANDGFGGDVFEHDFATSGVKLICFDLR